MYSLTGLLFLLIYAMGCFVGITIHPLWGVITYLATYSISPSAAWWGNPIPGLTLRYNLIAALCLTLGMLIHSEKLTFKKLLSGQEILLIVFLLLVGISIPLGLGLNPEESNATKMIKVCIFLLMMSHVVTTLKSFEILIWSFILTGLYLGYDAFSAPSGDFRGARFHSGVGGSDFMEGNFLSAHFAMLLPFIGAMFLRGGWKVRLICLLTGGFVVNGIILCRSRSVFLAILIGAICALIFSPRKFKVRVLFWMSVGLIGTWLLIDPGYLERMGTISTSSERMDYSSSGRLEVWKVSLAMAEDHPLGIGEGNFKRFVGTYNPDLEGLDTHNTFFRCLAELGIPGVLCLGLLTLNAFHMLFRLRRQANGLLRRESYHCYVWATGTAILIYVIAGFFITTTYIQDFYLLLILPVILTRCAENEIAVSSIV